MPIPKMVVLTVRNIVKIELTDWFPIKVKPVRDGLYQVQTATWPWQQYVEFDKKDGWIIDRGERIIKWRGLTLEQECPEKE